MTNYQKFIDSIKFNIPDINIRRVIDDDSELENIPSITYENLCQHTRINLKTLITLTQ